MEIGKNVVTVSFKKKLGKKTISQLFQITTQWSSTVQLVRVPEVKSQFKKPIDFLKEDSKFKIMLAWVETMHVWTQTNFEKKYGLTSIHQGRITRYMHQCCKASDWWNLTFLQTKMCALVHLAPHVNINVISMVRFS